MTTKRPKKKSRNPSLREPVIVGEFGRRNITIYERFLPRGGKGFLVSNPFGPKRRFESYASYKPAYERAVELKRKITLKTFLAGSLSDSEAREFIGSKELLAPFGLTVGEAVIKVAECLALGIRLAELDDAVKAYLGQQENITPKRVSDVVTELLETKERDGAADRYVADLRHRLNRFAGDFQRDIHHVTGPQIQHWLEGLKDKKRRSLSTQSYLNYRRVLSVLFSFAQAHGYCQANPVEKVQTKKNGNGGKIEIYEPQELVRLLNAATPEFLPSLAIGAFAGLRSAEIQRLRWEHIDLEAGFIHVGSEESKTRSRRLVPIAANLAAWLKSCTSKRGRIWKATVNHFPHAQRATALATGVKASKRKWKVEPLVWRHNALRHSFISYRLAQTNDAAKVSLEAGNSPQMVFRHYRELVRPREAELWFGIRPEGGKATNVLELPAQKGAVAR